MCAHEERLDDIKCVNHNAHSSPSNEHDDVTVAIADRLDVRDIDEPFIVSLTQPYCSPERLVENVIERSTWGSSTEYLNVLCVVSMRSVRACVRRT